ncbi:sigma-70 family RNA polymerase sigma factor [Pigmentiphaga aceris]|uniref:Sigma-70 family RNA polymerase sigma factor n=1 Tax=Pigmentiphaga aceris TaxID=1940612 RepID=A0A5C0B7A3_9BURK|nr:sigma-70 family RNA polymerase sigma factor [Pigmentiphaga aceris]QEI09450.1 sigma-70 family RNA polymerase sigma factor [Pigmentiphaga aceris]
MVVRYYRELLNHFANRLRNRDGAADLVQEAYVRLLSMQHAGQSVQEPRALLYRTAHNLMIDQHRHAEVRDHEDIDGLAESEQPAAPTHLQPDEAYAFEQRARAMHAVIDALPPRCREAFVLNRFEGLSHQEVAEHMGISRNMVAQHVIRGVLACKACDDALRVQQPISEGQS